MLQRAELMKSLLDTPRDVDSDCQYPTGWIRPELYQLLYTREPVATRVVEVFPKECFQVSPSVYEDEDAGTVTPFEEAWDALGKQLRGEQSFYQEEESSVIWDFLLDADIKSGIGHYAAILLGLDDGAPLDQPVDLIDATKPVKGSVGGSSAASRRLLFMQVYPETAVRINALETNTQNPRYGQPTEYEISMLDPLEFSSLGLGVSLPTNRATVHWSRVIHVSESGVLHTPRQRPVLNRLLDTRKLYSSSAEMFWRGAFPGYAIKTQPQLGADVDINRQELKDELTNYSNSLQRFLVLMGMDVTALAPQVSDPASQIDKQIEAICIQLGIPKRIFLGSERGELASSQDDQAWNDRLKQRQLGVITPRIIIPVVDRLISLRVLPRPAKGYRVSWPDLTSKSDEEKAGIATQRTQAVSVYVAGQLETTLAPMDFWTRIMGFTEDEAQSIIDNAEEIKQQKEKEQAAKDAEAAKVQAEAQAKMDAAAKTAADATGTEQTPTAPGLPASPGKPFGGKGSQSPTSTPPNASGGQPGGSNTSEGSLSPVAHAFDPSQPRDSHGMWSQGSGGADGGTGQKDNARLVTDYLGHAPKGEVHVLPDAEFNTRFVSESDRMLGGVAAIRTPDGKIYLREGHESSGLHEVVHAAGLLEDNVSTYINEGMTQAVAEHIADTHSLTIPRTYRDEVKFVHEYLVPATGKPLPELARGYAGAKDKAKYLADSIMKAHGDKFGQEEWGSNPHESIYQDMRGAIGPSPHLDYLIHEVKVKTPVAHSDPTLVADFDPSQARDTHGRWSPSGKANAFDKILPSGGTKKDQVVRDFYKTVHDDISTTRPAGDPRFHDPLRLHIEKQLHELAGDHGEALYRTGKAGMTQIAFKKHEVNVVTDAPGQVTIFSEHLHGPDPRDPTTFTITHQTPHEEVAYRLRRAAGLKVDKAAAEKYMAADKKARNEFRAQRKAAQEAQKTAREARRAEREARRLSTQNVSLSAEEVSQLVNSSGLDINAVGDSLDATPTSNILDDELLDRILENLDLASNAVAGPNPWTPYVGKRGGRGWKNGITGRVAYQLNQPGLGRQAAATPVGTGASAAPAPGQPRVQRADPTDVKNHIAKLLSDPSKITAADIHKVREDLLSMTVAQIHGVRKDLGLKASGVKKDLADKVASRALAGLGKVQTQPQTAPTPPQPQPPAPAQHPMPAAAPAQHPPSHLDVKDPVAVRAAVHAFIASKNWSGGAAGILQAYAHGSDTPLEKLGAHLASLTGVPHHVGFSLAHTAVKELVAGLPTHQPKAPTPPVATPAQPATGSPSPLHRGANVITGVPAQAPMALPTVPHKEEIEWSTGKPEPGTLHGVDFAPAPHHFWEHVKDKDIGEPAPTRPINRAGVMVQEPDGRIWIVRPTNEFGDRKHTLPGGGVETGLTHQQNALKEVWEETGLQVEITGHLGDFRDSNNGNNGRLYIGRRIGGAPWDAKIEPHIIDRKTGKPSAESSEVLLVTPERAGKLLHRSDDLAQLMTVAPIPLGTATRGRGSEPLKKLLEAVQPAAKAYKDAKQAVNATPGNAEMHAIQDIRGFNAKPTVVSKNDMDALVAKGDHIEVLRGLSANAKPNVSARRVVDTLAEQFRTGDHFPGYGIFGSGTYTDSTKGYGNIASKYASGQRGGGGSDAGATLRMAIPKDAKIVKFSELQSKVPHAPPDFTDHGPSSYNSNDDWRGMHAALAGYDAIHMDNHGYGHDFYVILNRGVVTVQKEDATGHIIR
jgi:ADP-ribose pyrophosphatase YjhB (NUDIX family)